MSKALISLAVAVVVMASSTAMAADLRESDGREIIGKRYVLTRVNGQDFKSEFEVFAVFEDGKVSGAVCNRFSAQLDIRDGVLKGDIVSTRMACPTEEMSVLENSLFAAIRNGVAYAATGDVLTLRRDDQSWQFRRAGEESTGDDISWDSLARKTFTLVQVDGEDFKIDMGHPPHITFGADGRVSGIACNNFTGEGKLEAGVLTVEKAATTMRLCINEPLMIFERYFHKMLGDGVTVELNTDGILILSGDGRVLRFEQEHD